MTPRSSSPDNASGELFLALLRGINVGGKNRLPMAELRALAEGLDWRDVRTYIQSGNVIFRAPHGGAADPLSLEKSLAEAIEDRFSFEVPVIVRSASQLAAVAAKNPYRSDYGDEENKALHVGFLAAEPDPERLAALDPNRSPPDAFSVLGREIYLHTPGGLARTKLTNAYFDSKLATVTTVRNWRTIHKLLAMTRE